MAGRLESKTALITGGASGIGRAAAMVFAREGARVAVADMQREGGEETVKAIRQAGGQAVFVRCDVSSNEDVRGAIDAVVKAYGRLDCAFNNAGIIAPIGKLADETEEWFDRTIAVNLKGVWFCMKYEIKQMLKQNGGAIVNTASAAGLVGSGGSATYTAADPVLTIAPPFCLSICLISYFMQNHTPFKFTAIVRSNHSSVSSANFPIGAIIPALLNAQSSRPYAFTTASIAPRTSSLLDTSHRTNTACPPACRIALTVSSPPSRCMSATATLAPSRANTIAAARPIPDAPPVINAVLLSSLPAIAGLPLLPMSPIHRGLGAPR